MHKYYIDHPTVLQNDNIKYDNTGFTFDGNGVWYEKNKTMPLWQLWLIFFWFLALAILGVIDYLTFGSEYASLSGVLALFGLPLVMLGFIVCRIGQDSKKNNREQNSEVADNYLQDTSEMRQDKNVSVFDKLNSSFSIMPKGVIIETILTIALFGVSILFLINHGFTITLFLGSFSAFMAISAFRSYNKVRGEIIALRKGYYIIAKGEKFWLAGDYDNNVYNFSAVYLEPKTKINHRFVLSSGNIEARELEKLVGAEITVYINPDNMGEYFIDTEDALRKLALKEEEMRVSRAK